MLYNITGSELVEKKWYPGIVTGKRETDTKLIIGVTLNKDPENQYVKSIFIDENINSPFVQTAEELGIIRENGQIDTSLLKDLHVKATLERGRNGSLYINMIRLNQKYYEKLEKTHTEE